MARKILILVTCLAVIPLVAQAQGEPGWDKMSLGANFEFSLPVGDFGDIAGTGYGGNLRFQYGGDPRGVFTMTAGYLVWSKQNITSTTSIEPHAFNFFLGGKYYFFPGFFGTVEGGMYFINYTYEGPILEALGSVSRFMLPIGVGFQKSGFEVGARYMLLNSDFNSFSFTLGYNFAL